MAKKAFKKIKHPVLSNEDFWERPALAKRFLQGPKFTKQDYINWVGGKTEIPNYGMEKFLEDTPHNTPANNDKALKMFLSDPKHFEDHDYAFGQMLEHAHLSKKGIDQLIDYVKSNKNKYHKDLGKFDLNKQPALDKSHLMKMARMQGFKEFARNPKVDEDVMNQALNTPNEDGGKGSKEVLHELAYRNDLKPEMVHKILDHVNYRKNPSNVDSLLENLSPEERKEVISKKIGLTGGKTANEGEDHNSRNPEDWKWDNWISGPEKDHGSVARELASSKHLSPEQIEHIKHHGTTDEKLNLFNNENIDPKHGAEMYGKWLSDSDEHGYPLEDLKEHLKEKAEKDGEYYDDYRDDARQKAEDENPFTQWIEANTEDSDWMGKNQNEWVSDKLNEEGTDHDSPDYAHRVKALEDQYDQEVKKEKESGEIPDAIYQAYDESNDDDISRHARQMFNDDAENFHLDKEHLPEHIREHLPNIAEIEQKRREAVFDKSKQKAEDEEWAADPLLSKQLPKRSHEQAYGDNQHMLEMAKDYADANGGKIDLGHLIKTNPNLKDKWKQIFHGQGKISSQDIQTQIDSLPKHKYDVSYKKWNSDNAQNINRQDQAVIRLDHSLDSLKPLQEDPKLYNLFNKISEVSQRSGHPSNANTIGWARVDTTNPKHWMVDELQSDFGTAARDYLDEHGKKEEAGMVQKIIDHHKNWREALLNHVVKLAKLHGVEKVSTHSPESKSHHTGSENIHSVYKDSYQKIPRAMGFKPVPYTELPLTESGINNFKPSKKVETPDDRANTHLSAMEWHGSMANAHNSILNNLDAHGQMQFMDGDRPMVYMPSKEDVENHKKMAKIREEKFEAHKAALAKLKPGSEQSMADISSLQPDADTMKHAKMWAEKDLPTDHEYDQKINEPLQVGPGGHSGHTLDLTPMAFKKSLDEAETLYKAELSDDTKYQVAMTLKQIQDNSQLIESLKNQNPDLYTSLSKIIQSLVEIIKDTGIDPQELQIADQGEGQPQGQPGGEVSQPKDQPITHGKMNFAPGAVRTYGPGNQRIKQPDGSWSAAGSGLQPGSPKDDQSQVPPQQKQ